MENLPEIATRTGKKAVVLLAWNLLVRSTLMSTAWQYSSWHAATALLLIAAVPLASASGLPKSEVDYNRDIRPIFSENCYACHGPDSNKRKAGLRFDRKQDAFKELEIGRAHV